MSADSKGALLHELNARLGHGVLPDDPIIQQEYQKRMRHHGIKIRPDIIVHVPFERGVVEGRDEGNFVAIELKRRATVKEPEALISRLQMNQSGFGTTLITLSSSPCGCWQVARFSHSHSSACNTSKLILKKR